MFAFYKISLTKPCFVLSQINLDEQEQLETAQKPSSDVQAKPDLEADNKQLRELVTSLHQKQQTTSLEVLANYFFVAGGHNVCFQLKPGPNEEENSDSHSHLA